MASAGETDVKEVDVDGMREYLTQMEVVFAMLFGSHARETADESDVDIALCFPDEMDAYERFRLRNRVDANLQEYEATADERKRERREFIDRLVREDT